MIPMIRFNLTCEHAHTFDSWFQSGAAFDSLKSAGMLVCAVCGSPKVDKALMAPAVAPSSARPAAQAPRPSLAEPASELEAAIRALREKVEAESDYVGDTFAREARAMHEGEIPERAIWGETKPDEARALIEDGIPVLPLPFGPKPREN